MTRLVLCLCTMLILYHPDENYMRITKQMILTKEQVRVANEVTEQKALDMVQMQYAANFTKEYTDTDKKEYYYKLQDKDYYLVYEGNGRTEQEYLFHLYEFVVDETDSGIGHTVTYGWYTVDKTSGIITDTTQ